MLKGANYPGDEGDYISVRLLCASLKESRDCYVAGSACQVIPVPGGAWEEGVGAHWWVGLWYGKACRTASGWGRQTGEILVPGDVN